MRVIALLNQKGGVGKTSVCHHLAGALSKMNKRVLLVDNDPQSSLSQGLFGPDEVLGLDPRATIAQVYAGMLPFPGSLIRPTGVPRVDIVPGSRTASDHNVPRPFESPLSAQACLRNFLHEVDLMRLAYDLVLVDCPPNLHLCSWAALVASHHLIVPLHPEDYAAQGLADVAESAELVRSRINPGLTTLGYLISRCVLRKGLHRMYEQDLRDLYGPAVFRTRIRDLVAFGEAIGRRLPVEQYEHRSEAAHDMRALAVEVLERAGLAAPAARKSKAVPTPNPAEVH